MVYWFVSTAVDPPVTIFVGKHKEENEDLIKYGWEEDVWVRRIRIHAPVIDLDGLLQFHVDNLSSAHAYLRLEPGQDWASIPKALLDDCAQLTKANSIEGNKKDNITVIYTPWKNLRKDASMAVGQVSFHQPNSPNVRKIHVPQRGNAIVNRLNKTRTETFPDFKALRDANTKEKQKAARLQAEEKKKQDRKEKEERETLKWQKDHAYDELNREDLMRSNQEAGTTMTLCSNLNRLPGSYLLERPSAMGHSLAADRKPIEMLGIPSEGQY